jgi:PBSX family phage portal protein
MNYQQRIRRFRQTSVTAKVTSIGVYAKRADTSRQVEQEDVFSSSVEGQAALIPPYDPRFLFQCIERNNMLKQCIAAMVTNTALCGFDIAPTEPDKEPDDSEAEELQSFIDSANSEESLTTVHAQIADDYESVGYAFLEVIRDRKKRPTIWRRAKAIDTRLMPKDLELQEVTYDVLRGRRIAYVTERRAFRRYVQIINGKSRYFREFGDQRQLNMDTGSYGPCPEPLQATEIIHIRQNSNDPYGVPRWINQLPSILGSRESEEVNLRYFQDNTIPPMILSVSGGRLTAQSYRELKDILEKQGIGAERQHKIILIEAVPEREGLDDKGTVTLRIDKLTDARQSDALFAGYDDSNQAKIRSSFRLPPVAVGLSQDVTFATANVSAFIAESQVYLPQRNIYDEIYNKRIVNGEPGLGLKTCKLVSMVPLASSPDTIIKSMTALNVMGALTPRMANELGNQLLQVDLEPYPEEGEEGYEEWMDLPIALTLKTGNTHAEQSLKDPTTKGVEDSGDISQKQPEHGSE